MKNHQYIRQLPVKELAELLIKEREVPDYDEGLDGEWYQCGSWTQYILPDGSTCDWDIEDAIRYTVDWLNADHKEK